ncbi:MAG: gas vesicle protein [Blastocatellia bacterium]|nr:gas vesicle protein [Blastocatellia bacterium]
MPSVVKYNAESPHLAELIERILDRGLVIDAWVRVSLIGIDLLEIEVRVVVASLDTYFKYAERLGMLEPETPTPPPVPEPARNTTREKRT